MNPANWDGGTWIAAVGGLAGAMCWMTAMWIRAGRILQKIDDFSATQTAHGTKLAEYHTRILRLEIKAEA